MRFTFTLVMFMATFLWSWMSSTDAENTDIINNVAPAPNVKLVVNKTRRLRGQKKWRDEERMDATDTGMANVLHSTPSAHSSQTVEGHKPLLKFGSALQFLVMYWVLIGALVGAGKLTQMHKSSGVDAGST
ncbi:hypothetical protein PI124_g13209 [Phytophthora idaei]|nr:hypothetical protein PI125_g12758 [Phytophthora idaei]KAG3149823.1 hypothetical protein PI126_g11833 [Phytophthora idaei]KAG3241923.1 hypothetical protein PI124_g13209 [Phytophthora idaei]